MGGIGHVRCEVVTHGDEVSSTIISASYEINVIAIGDIAMRRQQINRGDKINVDWRKGEWQNGKEKEQKSIWKKKKRIEEKGKEGKGRERKRRERKGKEGKGREKERKREMKRGQLEA